MNVKTIHVKRVATTLLAVLAMSAAWSTPALADDAVPPSETPSSAAPAAGSDSTSGSNQSLATSPAELTSSDEEAGAESGAGAPAPTERTSEIVIEPDPLWCPSGVAPNPVNLACTNSGSLTGLVTAMGTGPTVNGVIWIEDGTDASVTNIEIDGTGNWTAAPTVSLTLKGGWTGAASGTIGPGGTLINTSTPSVINGESLSIHNWTGAITITDVTVTNATSNPDCASCSLFVDTVGTITVERVHADGNGGTMAGAFLSNEPGTGALSIKNSTFNNNAFYGLVANSQGAITLTDVTASNNAIGHGAQLNNYLAPTPMNVTLNGLNTFNDNGDDGFDWGLYVRTDGSITIKHVVANANQTPGVILDNASYGSTVAKTVTISGSGQFSGNSDDGLSIIATGIVTLNNLSATLNLDNGVIVDNETLGTAQAVYLKGSNAFTGNVAGNGLWVQSDGLISVSNITAHQNGAGMHLQNDTPPTPQNVTLSGYVVATGNGAWGTRIFSQGAISAANVQATDNGDYGLKIDNTAASTPKPVTLTGINVFSDNAEDGLWIESDGAVTLSNVTALNNGYLAAYRGAVINNQFGGTSVQQNVTISGFNQFSENGGAGLLIWSYGAVTLSNLTAHHNGFGGIGAPLLGNGIDQGVYVNNEDGLLMKPVTISGTSQFIRNDGFGLQILSDGAVTLNNVTAFDNIGGGTAIQNESPSGLMPAVILNGVNGFDNNHAYGLLVSSDGPIAVSKVHASGNIGGGGATLSNSTPPALASPGITILGYLNADGNLYSGLAIFTDGVVLATNLSARGNGDEGVLITNDGAPTPKAVTITGLSAFKDNGGDGLYIQSGGTVTLGNLTALANGGAGEYGVVVKNNFGGTANQQNVTISGVNLISENYAGGLQVISYGTVMVSNLSANHNGHGGGSNNSGSGAAITNSGGTLPKPVTLSGSSAFVDNDGVGLDVESSGAITVSNLRASYNGLEGANLVNPGAAQAKVTLGGYGVFDFNSSYGFQIVTSGPVLTANLSANQNGSHGVIIGANGTTIRPSVTLSGTNSFYSNASNGLIVRAEGNISVSNLSANYNDIGALLDTTYYSTGMGSVTLNGFGNFTQNSGTGLSVDAYGKVTLSRVRADSNSNGIVVLSDGSVTITCSSAYDNSGSGLLLRNSALGPYAGVLTFNGFTYYSNAFDLDIGATVPVVLPCP